MTAAAARQRLRPPEPPKPRTPGDYLKAWGQEPPGRAAKRRPLAPVRPAAELTRTYGARLLRLVDAMHRSVARWLRAAYRREEPEVADLLAADASPANELLLVIRRLSRRWRREFDGAAPDLARYFAQTAARRSDEQLRLILRRAGISVKFQMTRPMQDALSATVNENVALIRSIPQQYLAQVEGHVMRSVQAGRDLHALTTALQDQFGVVRRRAELIARDQNNKVVGALQRIRHVELGLEEAVWVHSRGGRKPRPTHVAMHGKSYDVRQGMWDPDEEAYVFPGQLISCRCVSRPVVTGLS